MSTATSHDPLADGAMTTPEVARYLNLHPETVRQYIHTQGLPAHRLQRKWRFVRAEVDVWLTERGVERPSQEAPTPPDPYRAAVRRLVDEAPVLTAAQADRIAAVLRGGR